MPDESDNTPSIPGGEVSTSEILKIPAVRRYLLSTVFAAMGQNLLITVLFKQVFDITGDELDIGLIGLAQFLPALLLVLVSGWIADRFDRRRVTALFMSARGLCGIALVIFSLGAADSVWPLFLIAAALGTADAIVAPARRSILPFLADKQVLPQVVVVWTGTFVGASIVGPVMGGFLYSAGASWAYGVAAAFQFAAAIPILLIRYHREPERMTERPTWSAAVEGLRFVRRTPVVFGTITLDLFAVLFGGAIALIPAVASERLGVGDIAYGWLRAAPGIGAAAMAVWLAFRPLRRHVGATLLWVVAIFGAGHIVFGLTHSYAVAFIALIVVSAADMISMNIRGSIVPLVTPDDQLGRVNAVEGVFIGASNELGAFESGVAARAVGLPWAIAGGGIITVAIAGITALAFPALRRIDTFESLRPESDEADTQA
jgi:MFS family permease